MATVTLSEGKIPWVEVPEWLDGDIKILLFIRQLSTSEKAKISKDLQAALKDLDAYVRRLTSDRG